MPTKIESYRTRAAECLEQARRTSAEEDKATFLQMAEEWLTLAASCDQPQAHQPVFALVG